MKIAIIFEGDIYHQRGEFLAIHNRMKSFLKSDSITFDAYVCGFYCDKLLRWLTKAPHTNKIDTIQIEGIQYHCVWYKRSWLDIITRKLFKRSTNFEFCSIKKLFNLEGYDLIYAHSLQMGKLAISYKIKSAIPCVVAWHGSDIHSLPFQDKNWYKYTQQVLRGADCNLFVSKELQKIANGIAENVGIVTLNGIDPSRFYPFDKKRRKELREKMGFSENEKLIAFIGNCLPVKNVQFLPTLFSNLHKAVNNCHFFIIGNGSFVELFSRYDLPLTLCGNVENDIMPDYYNIFDLVVLPSNKEGLPITCLEAVACTTPFIGSRVGEIENVVGEEYTVPLGQNFEEEFVRKCIEILTAEERHPVTLKDCYNSDYISNREIELFQNIVREDVKKSNA